jgi:hypothetical protein
MTPTFPESEPVNGRIPAPGTQQPPRVMSMDVDRPSVARIYDALQGGDENWAIDRQFATDAAENMPLIPVVARAHREFVQRVAVYFARAGVEQIIDLGAGIPAEPNVHQLATAINPQVRVVYVDAEPLAIAKLDYLFTQDQLNPQQFAFIQRDVRDVAGVWHDAVTGGILDPEKPIGVMLCAVLHFLPEHAAGWPDVSEILARYRALLPRGSALALTHVTESGVPDRVLPQIRGFVERYRYTPTPALFRTRDEIAACFGDFELTPPGLAWIPEWHRSLHDSPASQELASDPASSCVLGGVGWKPPGLHA